MFSTLFSDYEHNRLALSLLIEVLWLTFVENVPLEQPEVDPLENMLIEHPSMSVYQMRSRITEDELLDSDEDEEDCPRSVCIPSGPNRV